MGLESKNSVLEQLSYKAPKKYRVIMYNDDYTSMDFVVSVLTNIFHKSEEEAMKIMLDIHEKGVGVCGEYPYEIAYTKASMVKSRAREQGFPLRCEVKE